MFQLESLKMNKSFHKVAVMLGAIAFSLSLGLPTLAQTNNTAPTDNNAPNLDNPPSGRDNGVGPSNLNNSPNNNLNNSPNPSTTTPNNNLNNSPSSTPNNQPPDRVVPITSAGGSGTIDAIVRTSPSFELFNALLRVADRQGVFSNELASDTDYTVFAPTDEALAAVPSGTFKALVQPENRDLLVSVLQNHIVRGRITSNDLASRQIRSMGGSSLAPVGGQGALAIANARIIGPDLAASNGVIHAVDQLIITPDVQAGLSRLTPQSAR
jgi:uncharacterized surface protein with fasciclin (FAS1) repeats